MKQKNKSLDYCAKLLGAFEANEIKRQNPLPQYHIIHHAGIDFLSEFNREFKTDKVFLFITFTDETNTGKLFIKGSEDQINTIGTQITDILDGKFNKSNTYIQGRFNNIKKLNECDKLIKIFFEAK